ncbi:MAG: hypothetical protein ACOYXY_14435 [Thermodesulfobacteriota bacterium]
MNSALRALVVLSCIFHIVLCPCLTPAGENTVISPFGRNAPAVFFPAAASSPQPVGLNPLAAPGSAYPGSAGSQVVPLSSGLLGPFLPRIPNFEFGFLYTFGPNVRAGRFIADYVLPVSIGSDSVVFGEAHAEFQNFWQSPRIAAAGSSVANSRADLSFGGGYRQVVAGNTLVGVTGFFDTTKVFDQWYSSGGVGLEMIANLSDYDAVDLRFNWYGNLFNREVLINAFRNGGGSFDIEAGYSHALFNQAFDLRLKYVGYQFDIGDAVYGYMGGAELTTRDGVFSARYEHGYDRVNGSYDTIGGFVNVGFQVENLFRGESPLTFPEPIFRSPRNVAWWLTRKVNRNWHLPAAVVQLRQAPHVPDEAGPVPLFTRTAYVGVVGGPFGAELGALNAELTAADLVGVNSVVITWDSGVVWNGQVNFVRYGTCAGPRHDITAASSPPGITVTNPSVWNLICGPWTHVTVFNHAATANFGTLTLSFFP